VFSSGDWRHAIGRAAVCWQTFYWRVSVSADARRSFSFHMPRVTNKHGETLARAHRRGDSVIFGKISAAAWRGSRRRKANSGSRQRAADRNASRLRWHAKARGEPLCAAALSGMQPADLIDGRNTSARAANVCGGMDIVINISFFWRDGAASERKYRVFFPAQTAVRFCVFFFCGSCAARFSCCGALNIARTPAALGSARLDAATGQAKSKERRKISGGRRSTRVWASPFATSRIAYCTFLPCCAARCHRAAPYGCSHRSSLWESGQW